MIPIQAVVVIQIVRGGQVPLIVVLDELLLLLSATEDGSLVWMVMMLLLLLRSSQQGFAGGHAIEVEDVVQDRRRCRRVRIEREGVVEETLPTGWAVVKTGRGRTGFARSRG